MKTYSLNLKMVFLVGWLIAGNAATGYLALDKMSELNATLAKITDVLVPRNAESQALRDLLRRVAIAEKGMLAEADHSGVQRASRELHELSDNFLKSLAMVDRSANENGKAKLARARDQFARWREINQEIQRLALEGNMRYASTLSNDKGKQALAALQGEISGLVDLNLRAMDEETRLADQEYAKSHTLLTMVLLTTILTSIGLAFIMLRAISTAISGIIADLNANSSQVALAAQQIATSSRGLSQMTVQQARSLAKTAEHVREIKDTVKKNAEAATKACELSLFSESAAQKGKTVVRQMISAITEINDANQNIQSQIADSNKKIAEIVDVIAEIGRKTKVINDIVYQTKLLSFNASVEAARAREHGRGFGIVAEEVRNLAQMSGKAAREITLLLDEGVQKVEGIVHETRSRVENLAQEAGSKVEAGTRIANQCSQVLDEIVKNVTSVNQMALDISNSSDEQAQGVEEVFKAVGHIDEVTQDGALVAVDTAKVGEELSRQAKALRKVVGELVRTVRGGAVKSTVPASSVESGPTLGAATLLEDVIARSEAGPQAEPEPKVEVAADKASSEPQGPAMNAPVVVDTGDEDKSKAA